MNPRRAFDQGMVAGVFLMLGANAFYWMISSWSSGVSLMRTFLVIIQLIIGISIAAWFVFRRTQYPKAT